MSIGSYAHLQGTPAHEAEGSALTWWVRAANMITAYSEVVPGSVLNRADNADEYFVWALFTPCRVTVGDQVVDVPAGSVVIVPPGESAVSFSEAGSVWRGFTSLSADLLAKAPNSDEYAEHPAGVAPVDAWPTPPEGYKIRVYRLDDTPAGKAHCYVHRTAMTNFRWPVPTEPRRPHEMSPHTHEDFEQVSIIHSGTMVHHMRRAWSRNMNEWHPDEHVVVIAPAIAISKPPDIHTTQAVTSGDRVGLIDFFSPVRWDFSNVDGMVVNRAEYPVLAEKPPSYAGVTTVYAPDDPRAALNRMSQRA
jgi:mannose-6-phosphate isomerase-like protein (cupin superfamily)